MNNVPVTTLKEAVAAKTILWEYTVNEVPTPSTPTALYLEAAARGLYVCHPTGTNTRDFESTSGDWCRSVGWAWWNKTKRQWAIGCFSNCTAAEVAGIVDFGLWMMSTFGRIPDGRRLRSKEWIHYTSTDSGDEYARAGLCWRLDDPTDVVGRAEAIAIPDDLSSLVLT